jgi:hypothetical protein
MNRLFTLFLFWFGWTQVVGQDGDFFVSQFSPSFNQEDQIYFDVLFTDQDELIAANRSGIVRFDGQEWSLIATPSAPLSVALDATMTIYVACANDFGRIIIKEGIYQFESMAPLPTDRLFTQQVISHGGKIFFLQDFRLFEYDPYTDQIGFFDADTMSGGFVSIFPFEGVLWSETVESSYYLSDSLQMGGRILPDSGIVMVTASHPTTQDIIVSSHDGRLFQYTDQFEEIKGLEGSVINDIAWVSEDLFAVSTLAEGVFFYDINTKEIVANTDSRNGLPDNEIFAIASDNASGVWVANTFGFSRIAPLLPIRSFNHYPGLEGNLTTAVYSNNTWHLATSDGVYYFDEVNNYKNRVYYVPKTQVASTKVSEPEQKTVTEQKTIDDNKNFKLRTRIGNFLNRDEKSQSTQLQSTTNEKPRLQQLKTNVSRLIQTSTDKAEDLLSRIKLPIATKNKVEYERRVKKELVSTQYLYKQIPDITEKIKQLIAFGEAIIAVTPSGILEINNQQAEEIFSEPVRYVLHPKGSHSLWVSTQNSGVIKMEKIGDVWVETQSITALGDIVLSIYADTTDLIWMAGANQLFEITVTDTSSTVVNQYDLDNQFFDNIKIAVIRGQLTLINNQGVFVLDTASNQLKADEVLMEKVGKIKRHLLQSDGRVWIHNERNWMRLEPDGGISQFTYLKLFPDMSFIDQVGDEFWLINDHQSLYKFEPDINDSIPSSKMFIKKLRNENGLLTKKEGQINISYDQNSVFVDLARPDYMGLVNVQYAYKMKGLNDKWSDWTSNHQFAFNYLPAGEYELELKSIDTFGREQLLEPIQFKVKPPYWQTTWFSALQVLFFTGLVLIASRLNRSNTENKRIVLISGLLTVVTIVMVIELLQNIAESFFGDLGSPVLAFGLDVLVALFIFPVEMLLRRIVTGNKPG